MGGSNKNSPAFARFAPLFFSAVLAAPFFAARASAQQPPPQVSPPLRVSVDRVNVGVIVTDSRSRFVGNLQKSDFHVFDDGIEQAITNFAAFDEPATVLLLVEAGPAVYLLEENHLRAAYSLLNGLSAGDRVAVVRYAEEPQLLCDFTTDKTVAMAALDQLRFNLGFASLNLSSSLAAVVDSLSRVPGKKSIVLLSTGVDTSSAEHRDALLARLKTGDVRIFAVSLAGELERSPKKGQLKGNDASSTEVGFAQAAQFLRAIAESTGGRAYFPKSAREFATGYAQIAQLVRHEYSVAFAPPHADGKIHSIEIRLSSSPAAAPAYHLDFRRAYLAPSSSN